jgi:Domain of unknown function (DU1801)
MATLKTTENELSVDDYFAAIVDDSRRADCIALSALMQKTTKLKPKMWGTSIVGFGSYHYLYESGHEGDACRLGFSSRANAITLYMASGYSEYDELMAKLGKHKMGKGCLYVKKLSDVNTAVLTQLIKGSFLEMARRHPD